MCCVRVRRCVCESGYELWCNEGSTVVGLVSSRMSLFVTFVIAFCYSGSDPLATINPFGVPLCVKETPKGLMVASGSEPEGQNTMTKVTKKGIRLRSWPTTMESSLHHSSYPYSHAHLRAIIQYTYPSPLRPTSERP